MMTKQKKSITDSYWSSWWMWEVIDCICGVMEAVQGIQLGKELKQLGVVVSKCVPLSSGEHLLYSFIHANADKLHRLRVSLQT